MSGRRRRGLDLVLRQPFLHCVPKTLVAKFKPALAFLGPPCEHVLEPPEGAPAVQSYLEEVPGPGSSTEEANWTNQSYSSCDSRGVDPNQPSLGKPRVGRFLA